jgi:hypothetical protein
VLVLSEMHLHRLMSVYCGYYNAVRTHLAPEKDAPLRRPVERFGQIIAQPMVGGLHQRYAPI